MHQQESTNFANPSSQLPSSVVSSLSSSSEEEAIVSSHCQHHQHNCDQESLIDRDETPRFDNFYIPIGKGEDVEAEEELIQFKIAQLMIKAFPEHFVQLAETNNEQQQQIGRIEKQLNITIKKSSIIPGEEAIVESSESMERVISSESLELEDKVIGEETAVEEHFSHHTTLIPIHHLDVKLNNGGEATPIDEYDVTSTESFSDAAMTSSITSSNNNLDDTNSLDSPTLFPSGEDGISHHENDMAGLNEKTKQKNFLKNVLKNYIHVKQLTGGTTNRLFLVKFVHREHDKSSLDYPQKVLVRCFGENSENLIDRKAEFHYIQQISTLYNDLAPRIYATFENGMIYKYYEGGGLDELGGARKHYIEIAKLMKSIHSITVKPFAEETHYHDLQARPVIFERTFRWLALLKHNRDEFNKRGGDKLSPNSPLNMDKIEEEVKLIESLCKDFPVKFCHNDLGAHNIILNEKESSYHTIDFEYCAYNYAAFDIGNFFCEFGGLCILPEAYPTYDEQINFFKTYYSDCENVTEELIEKSRRQALVMSMVSNLHWSVWSMLQSMFSKIDFDYLNYAERRMTWYYEMRDATLALIQ
ncbi:predicted protein [Naegleria gruberi]|uniref:ethanolamine kinase n=1 Tax=Naegleria gruberi TaxID=5762 RepID=D2VLH0_NAEGR|nr:uncharacterized protein NAEGRDRAFT_69776 [Naegleria gruberi]EFC42383.1 predicted protein [Naegleria gruberi]|eukprot:XP_002675127.1 predicted protein [Naegleria gruberi strain NEG-M]